MIIETNNRVQQAQHQFTFCRVKHAVRLNFTDEAPCRFLVMTERTLFTKIVLAPVQKHTSS